MHSHENTSGWHDLMPIYLRGPTYFETTVSRDENHFVTYHTGFCPLAMLFNTLSCDNDQRNILVLTNNKNETTRSNRLLWERASGTGHLVRWKIFTARVLKC